MPTVRRFRFSGIKRYTAAQVAVQESLAHYLSHRPFLSDFKTSLSAVLERYLKVPCNLGEVSVKPIGRKELTALLPDVACLLVIGAAPTESKFLVELDPSITSFAIDRLLGGAGDNGRIRRPLTEIEAGVLSFLILKLLSHFHTGWQTGQELALSLDRFAAHINDVRDIVDTEVGYTLVGARVAAGGRFGYARILVPDSLVSRRFAAPLAQEASTELELDQLRNLLKRLGDIPVAARVEAASLELSSEEIASLEVGDIIILENHELARTAVGLEGFAFMKLGTGEHGGIRGRLISDGDHLRFQVADIMIQEKPLEGTAMVQDGDDPDAIPADMEESRDLSEPVSESEDNLSQTQGLLRDVAAPVIVELGRIELNAIQVSRLRTGQILRLARGPNDPVDLVVNGKLFARGELIEVDGELGVRLLQVAGG
jgi:flagellar motor switch protein FliM